MVVKLFRLFSQALPLSESITATIWYMQNFYFLVCLFFFFLVGAILLKIFLCTFGQMPAPAPLSAVSDSIECILSIFS